MSLIFGKGPYYNGIKDKEIAMKKLFTVAACLAALMLLAPLSAQDASSSSSSKSTVYTKNFVIVKIWSHRLGYRVDYWTPNLQLKSLYIPMSLFTGSNGKARLVYGTGPEYPYLSVVWIDGEIDHLTLFAVDAMGDLTWGVLKTTDDLESRFSTDLAIAF